MKNTSGMIHVLVLLRRERKNLVHWLISMFLDLIVYVQSLAVSHALTTNRSMFVQVLQQQKLR